MKPESALPALLRRLWRHLSRRRRRQFAMLMVLMLVSAVAEVVSLGAIVPFIGVLSAPDRALRNHFIAAAARAWGAHSAGELVVPLAAAFALAAVLSGVIRMVFLWASTRFAFAAGAELSLEIYRRALYQPYKVHIARSSSEVISGLTHKTGTAVLGVMQPFMTLISSAVVIVAVLLALFAMDTMVAAIAAVGFGGSYWLITNLFRHRLYLNSRRAADQYTRVVQILQEGLGGIRDVLLDGTQEAYCQLYMQADRAFRGAQGENVFIAQSPRFIMESIGMLLIAALALSLSHRPGGIAAALPVLGALALGAQRLLPTLQQAYAAWASIAGSQAALADTIDLLDQAVPAHFLSPPPPPLEFRRAIHFEGVRFRYSSSGPWVLDGFDLAIPKGARIGLVGGTGGGKSTVLDLMMGLLAPTDGRILVDSEPLADDRIRAWQRTIAHVPQSVFLADTTLAENIAFGIPRGKIDMQRVRRAARHAQIAEFIESRPQAYEARVGERGVQLSGGQRQRIGIARALYKSATVLVLDEATSALDNLTERAVMDAIQGLARDLTIVLIAHRLTTVQHCDVIVELRQGKIVAQGPYEQLLESSESFRQMAQATS